MTGLEILGAVSLIASVIGNIAGIFRNRKNVKKGMTALKVANVVIEGVEKYQLMKDKKPEAGFKVKEIIRSLATHNMIEPELNRIVKIVTEPYRDQDIDR